MGHEDIVWEEDLTIRVLCWSWGILSLSDRSRLLSLCRFGSVGASEAEATRDPGYHLCPEHGAPCARSLTRIHGRVRRVLTLTGALFHPG